MNDIEQRIIDILRRETRVSEITRETRLVEDLSADVIDIFEWLLLIEDEFRIIIPTDLSENWETVGDIFDCVQERVHQ